MNPIWASPALHRNEEAAQDAPMEGLLAALALIVLVGAVVGNLYAQKRRARPRVSVYDAIRTRLEAERAGRNPDP
jgi:hypothetical protein